MRSGLVLMVLMMMMPLLLVIPVEAQNDIDTITHCVQSVELQYTLDMYEVVHDNIDLPIVIFEEPNTYRDFNRLEWAALIEFNIEIVTVEPAPPDDHLQENETLSLKILRSQFNESGWNDTNVSEGDFFTIDGYLNVTTDHVFIDGNVDDDELYFSGVQFQMWRTLNWSEWSPPLDIVLIFIQVWELRWYSWDWVCGGVEPNYGGGDIGWAVPIGDLILMGGLLSMTLPILGYLKMKRKRLVGRLRENFTLPYSRFISEEGR